MNLRAIVSVYPACSIKVSLHLNCVIVRLTSKDFRGGLELFWFHLLKLSAFFAENAQAMIGNNLRGTGNWSPRMLVLDKHAPDCFLASQTFCSQYVESPNDFVQLMKYAPMCSKEGDGVCQGTCACSREGTILIFVSL